MLEGEVIPHEYTIETPTAIEQAEEINPEWEWNDGSNQITQERKAIEYNGGEPEAIEHTPIDPDPLSEWDDGDGKTWEQEMADIENIDLENHDLMSEWDDGDGRTWEQEIAEAQQYDMSEHDIMSEWDHGNNGHDIDR